MAAASLSPTLQALQHLHHISGSWTILGLKMTRKGLCHQACSRLLLVASRLAWNQNHTGNIGGYQWGTHYWNGTGWGFSCPMNMPWGVGRHTTQHKKQVGNKMIKEMNKILQQWRFGTFRGPHSRKSLSRPCYCHPHGFSNSPSEREQQLS